jgi:hypothetical protein
MYFDRFDICEAYYVYAMNYHKGMYSKAYKIFGRLNDIDFKPSLSLTEDTLTENGKEIYQNLIDQDY